MLRDSLAIIGILALVYIGYDVCIAWYQSWQANKVAKLRADYKDMKMPDGWKYSGVCSLCDKHYRSRWKPNSASPLCDSCHIPF